jgi:hypothetical protein
MANSNKNRGNGDHNHRNVSGAVQYGRHGILRSKKVKCANTNTDVRKARHELPTPKPRQIKRRGASLAGPSNSAANVPVRCARLRPPFAESNLPELEPCYRSKRTSADPRHTQAQTSGSVNVVFIPHHPLPPPHHTARRALRGVLASDCSLSSPASKRHAPMPLKERGVVTSHQLDPVVLTTLIHPFWDCV